MKPSRARSSCLRNDSGGDSSMSRKKKVEKKKSPLPLVIIGGVLVVAVVAGGLLMGSNRTGGGAGQNASPQQQQTPVPRANVPPGAEPPRAKGPETAAVQMEEFGDYQCPSCGVFNPVVKKLQGTYGERLRVVFRHLPLQSIHRNAAMAARAAEAAGLQGRFWEMHDTLYATQKEWSDLPDPRPKFTEYAQRTGLDTERFKTDLEGNAVAARIVADVRRASAIGVTGTPTVFINGLQVRGITEEDLRREIESALSGRAGQ
jgi:protein-disulfide isomerase